MKKELLLFGSITIIGLCVLFPQKLKDLQSTAINYFTGANNSSETNNLLVPSAQEKVENAPDDTAEISSTPLEDDFFTPYFWQNATVQNIHEKISNNDIKKRNAKGVSLLMYAGSISNNIASIDELLNRGADIHTRDEHGRNALMYAAAFNPNPRILNFLLYNKAEIDATDKNGRTALIYAAMYSSNPEIIKTLLRHGAEIDKRVPHIQTQMSRASLSNKFIMALKLGITEAKNLVVNLVSNPFSEKTENNADLFDTLSNSIDNLSDKIINKEEGMTALMFAAKYSTHPAIVEALINSGADVKLYDNTGQTAVDYAKTNKNIYNSDIYWKMNDMLY